MVSFNHKKYYVMPGTPEAPQSNPEQTTFTRAEALAELADNRNKSRTTLRDKEKVLDSEREGLHPHTEQEYNYRKTLIQETQQAIQERAREENGLTEKMALDMVRERILDAQLERMQAEIDAKNNPDTLGGKLRLAFIEKWRKYPKTRMAIGVGLVVASGGFAAAGLGTAALVPLGARTAMKVAGTYMGAKAGQDKLHAMYERRNGVMSKLTRGQGDKSIVTIEQAAEMSSDERVKRMTALLSAGVMEGLGPQNEKHPDRASYEALRQAESRDIQRELEDRAEHYWGRNLLHKKGILQVLDQRVAEQLNAEHERLKKDKKANRIKTAIAGAAALTAIGLSVAHMAGVGGGSSENAQELHRAADDQWGSAGESYSSSEFIMDQVNGDESKLDAVTKHLNNIQEYQSLSPEAQSQVVQDLAQNRQIMEVVGDDGIHRWRIPKSTLQQAIFKHQ